MGTDLKIILFLVVILLFLFIQGRILERRRTQARRALIKKRWGKVPDREYDYEEYEQISHYFARHKREGYSVDDITWNDLDMDRVFLSMNHTYSSVGQEYLYSMLREPVFQKDILNERNRLAELFSNNEKVRERLLEAFYKAGRTRKLALADYLSRFSQLESDHRGRHILHMAAFLAAAVYLFAMPSPGILVFIGVLAFNIIRYYQSKGEVESYFQCIYYIVNLLRCSEEIVQIDSGELEPYIQELKGINSTFARLKRKVRFISSGSSMSGSVADIIMDYIRMLLHIDLISFYSIWKDVRRSLPELERMTKILGHLEACAAIASFRESLPYYTRPELLDQERLMFCGEEMYHPLIEEPVANSIHTSHSVLLTGSNASGKSTFLKMAGMNAILAQTIDTVCARKYRGNFYKIYSSMALRDDLENNESYYIVEIKSLKRVLDEAVKKEPVLVFIDEVLRGTNTVERIAASAEILKSLSVKTCLCFAATHDIELTYLLEKEYDNYHFKEEVGEGDIIFNYALNKGRTTTRNAIKLLGLMGYHPEIVERAQKASEDFMNTGKWKQV